jgi:large subunit ribosomal protein L10
MVKPIKVETVESIKRDYQASAATGGSVVFAQFEGMKVEEMFKLRRSLREKAVKLRVLKNTLVRIALQESGVSGAEEFLKGPIAVAFSPDEISAPKVLAGFAKQMEDQKKTGRLLLKGGVLNGRALSSGEVAHLATLPGREEVMAKLLALINAPAINLLRLIKEPSASLLRVTKAASERPRS